MKITDAILMMLPKNDKYVSIIDEVYFGDKEECLKFSLSKSNRYPDNLVELDVTYYKSMSAVKNWTLPFKEETQRERIGFVRKEDEYNPIFSISQKSWVEEPDFEYIQGDVQKIMDLCDVTKKPSKSRKTGKTKIKSTDVGKATVGM